MDKLKVFGIAAGLLVLAFGLNLIICSFLLWLLSLIFKFAFTWKLALGFAIVVWILKSIFGGK